MKIKNKVIVIGGNHHNTLGVIRALGEKGIKSYAIITNDNKFAFVKKSKYLVKSYIVKEDKNEILKILINEFDIEKDKTILIPTSDFAAITIDNNLTALKAKFIIPHIDNTQGMIGKYMDKYNQYKLAEKYNIPMAKSFELKLDKKIDKLKFNKFPYILKPIISAEGVKGDIRICNDLLELEEAIAYLRNKSYNHILIQEYIDYDYECDVPGISNNGIIIIPGIMKKIRIFPIKRGSSSFCEVLPNKHINLHNIISLIDNLKYNGIFDVEMFVKGEKIYINEINFRNSATCFSYCFDDIYLVYLWILLVTNNSIDKEKQFVTDAFYTIDENAERNLLLEKNISFKEYIRTHKISKGRLFHRKGDLKPSVYKYVYAVCRRLFK